MCSGYQIDRSHPNQMELRRTAAKKRKIECIWLHILLFNQQIFSYNGRNAAIKLTAFVFFADFLQWILLWEEESAFVIFARFFFSSSSAVCAWVRVLTIYIVYNLERFTRYWLLRSLLDTVVPFVCLRVRATFSVRRRADIRLVHCQSTFSFGACGCLYLRCDPVSFEIQERFHGIAIESIAV